MLTRTQQSWKKRTVRRRPGNGNSQPGKLGAKLSSAPVGGWMDRRSGTAVDQRSLSPTPTPTPTALPWSRLHARCRSGDVERNASSSRARRFRLLSSGPRGPGTGTACASLLKLPATFPEAPAPAYMRLIASPPPRTCTHKKGRRRTKSGSDAGEELRLQFLLLSKQKDDETKRNRARSVS